MEDCPLPEIGEALKPYIKTRSETTAFRNELHDYLESQLGRNDVPLTAATLPQPYDTLPRPPASALSGVRKAYWRALQAHADAQAKYDALRADLEQLKHRKSASHGSESDPSASVNDSYIPLLRQREKHRKLKAVEKAYVDISVAGDDLTSKSVEDVVRREVGELPTPPSTLPSSSHNSEVEERILDLKKVLIATKRRVDERKMNLASHRADDARELTPQAEIAGLQAALQELTGWMEDRLTVIANSEADAQSVESPPANATPVRTPASTKDIQALYEHYLQARSQLVQTVKQPPEMPPEHDINEIPNSASNWKEAKPNAKTPAEIILPYIPSITASKQQEQSLLQQNAYMRRQLSSAEAETDRLIRRLADESHLVQPGASQGEDWAKAAKEAGEATESYVNDRVLVGEKSTDSAKHTLEDIQTLPSSIDKLLHKT